MQTRYYIAVVVVCGLLLGCQKQQVQTADESSQPAEKAEVAKQPLTVKGFYIGMPKEKVLALLDRNGFTDHNETTAEFMKMYPVNETVVHRPAGTRTTTEFHQNPKSQFSYDLIQSEVTHTNIGIASFFYDNEDKLIAIKMDYQMVCFFYGVSSWTTESLAQIVIRENGLDKMIEENYPVVWVTGRKLNDRFYYSSDDASEIGIHYIVGSFVAGPVFYLTDIKYSFTRLGKPFH